MRPAGSCPPETQERNPRRVQGFGHDKFGNLKNGSRRRGGEKGATLNGVRAEKVTTRRPRQDKGAYTYYLRWGQEGENKGLHAPWVTSEEKRSEPGLNVGRCGDAGRERSKD